MELSEVTTIVNILLSPIYGIANFSPLRMLNFCNLSSLLIFMYVMHGVRLLYKCLILQCVIVINIYVVRGVLDYYYKFRS